MEIRITSQQILKVLYVLSWIIFLGVCVEAGGILCNSLFALFLNPKNAGYFWSGADLTALYTYDTGHFFVQTLIMVIVAVLKAIMFYLIIRIAHDKKIDLAQPFNASLITLISLVSYLSVAIGAFSVYGVRYAEWLSKKGINMPDIEQLRLGGADVWFFMGITLFVIARLFKRGAEIQAEHELTV